jgi:hypothetical protein
MNADFQSNSTGTHEKGFLNSKTKKKKSKNETIVL